MCECGCEKSFNLCVLGVVAKYCNNCKKLLETKEKKIIIHKAGKEYTGNEKTKEESQTEANKCLFEIHEFSWGNAIGLSKKKDGLKLLLRRPEKNYCFLE